MRSSCRYLSPLVVRYPHTPGGSGEPHSLNGRRWSHSLSHFFQKGMQVLFLIFFLYLKETYQGYVGSHASVITKFSHSVCRLGYNRLETLCNLLEIPQEMVSHLALAWLCYFTYHSPIDGNFTATEDLDVFRILHHKEVSPDEEQTHWSGVC